MEKEMVINMIPVAELPEYKFYFREDRLSVYYNNNSFSVDYVDIEKIEPGNISIDLWLDNIGVIEIYRNIQMVKTIIFKLKNKNNELEQRIN